MTEPVAEARALIDLRRERGERLGQLGAVAVRDDDRRNHGVRSCIDTSPSSGPFESCNARPDSMPAL